ncbi:hypothetical protein GCM10008902_01650 [[Clostridium] innocuum]
MRITETAVFLLCRILDISSDLAQFHRYTNFEVITKKNSSHVPAAVFIHLRIIGALLPFIV